MTPYFESSGHLSGAALHALAAGENLSELDRLEFSEHLDYCDECLTRFTALLTQDALLTPANSCRITLWKRIRLRAVRVLTSRYATAAAAIAIVTVLSQCNVFGALVDGSARLADYTPQPSAISQRFEDLGAAFNDGFARFSDLFTFGASGTPHFEQQQGGIQS